MALTAANSGLLEKQFLGQQLRVATTTAAATIRRKSNTAVLRALFTGGEPYNTLGIGPGSSKLDIKKAYRRLALKYHPDVCKGDHCIVKFKQVNAAYERVMEGDQADDDSGAEYDDDDDEADECGGWEGAWVF